jgi:hypothetical protein
MSRDFPRLLVATEFPPNASGGGPAIVRQMLEDWPIENLFWWSVLPDRDQRFNQKVAAHRVARIPPPLYPNRRWTRTKSKLLENVWAPLAARHFQKTLDLFQPDVAWVIPHIWSIPPLASVLPGSNIGFHTTMQDYVDSNRNIARFGAKRSGHLASLADELYLKATTRDATSHPMIADLRLRKGKEAAQMLHAGLDEADFDLLAAKSGNRTGEIRIAHAGTIVEESDFQLFVAALARARSQLPTPVTLQFFGSHSYRSRAWFDRSWMQEYGDLRAMELSERLRECAWGLATMALSDHDPRYNRFSFPTKFISYLAAGLPVITLGHPASSLVLMTGNYRVGLCLTSGEPAALESHLLAGLSIRDPWEQFGPEIQRCARTEFELERMREALHECFAVCRQRSLGANPAVADKNNRRH